MTKELSSCFKKERSLKNVSVWYYHIHISISINIFTFKYAILLPPSRKIFVVQYQSLGFGSGGATLPSIWNELLSISTSISEDTTEGSILRQLVVSRRMNAVEIMISYWVINFKCFFHLSLNFVSGHFLQQQWLSLLSASVSCLFHKDL